MFRGSQCLLSVGSTLARGAAAGEAAAGGGAAEDELVSSRGVWASPVLRSSPGSLQVLLQQGVSGQAAALGRGQQQTEGSIMRLRRRLDALQDLVSSPSHSQNSLGQDFHSDSSVSPHPTESSEPHRTRTSTD
ncbi:hypothetical protein GDO81_003970 [Engystomops pustulosus]|uniref:Uncharacterized protein n=1 Tax=Engystomops pustulosus TaxID=76066 RepID=A0AAV6ZXQ4_ENGPU|nr:hypothetical protein GDO81_003970 [Engystomops pustulosus]